MNERPKSWPDDQLAKDLEYLRERTNADVQRDAKHYFSIRCEKRHSHGHDSWRPAIGYDMGAIGISLANLRANGIEELARAVHAWHDEKLSPSQMLERFPDLELSERASHYEEGTLLDWGWILVDEWIHGDEALEGLIPILDLAKAQPKLRQLYPIVSAVQRGLGFSRCTGEPYTNDIPFVTWRDSPLYEVQRAYSLGERNEEVVFRGDAEAAIQFVIDNLPPNCGPAVDCTAEQLE